jgi:hypothetical protein
MLEKFGTVVMRGRLEACLAAFILAIVPFLSGFALAIMALVTLRKDMKEGGIVLLAILIPSFAMVILRHLPMIAYAGLVNIVIVWLLAGILRATYSWNWVLLLAGIIGLCGVIAIHVRHPDIAVWWQQKIQAYSQEAGGSAAAQQSLVLLLSTIATGMQVGMLLIGDLVWLLLARGWQARLFNPGKLSEELRAIRLPKVAGLLIVLLGLLAITTDSVILLDCLPVLLMPLVLAAISVVHYVFKARSMHWFWVVIFYGMLILLFPYMLVLLVLVGLIDSMLNVRQFKMR